MSPDTDEIILEDPKLARLAKRVLPWFRNLASDLLAVPCCLEDPTLGERGIPTELWAYHYLVRISSSEIKIFWNEAGTMRDATAVIDHQTLTLQVTPRLTN